jgi:hypothetical protein
MVLRVPSLTSAIAITSHCSHSTAAKLFRPVSTVSELNTGAEDAAWLIQFTVLACLFALSAASTKCTSYLESVAEAPPLAATHLIPMSNYGDHLFRSVRPYRLVEGPVDYSSKRSVI